MKKIKPILTSLVTRQGKVCVYTEKADQERAQGFIIALDFMPEGSDEYQRIDSEFLSRGEVQKYGGIKAIRNRILDEFSDREVDDAAADRFQKSLLSK